MLKIKIMCKEIKNIPVLFSKSELIADKSDISPPKTN